MRQVSPKLAAWLAELNRLNEEAIRNGYLATVISAREALARLTAAFVPPGPVIAWVNDELIAGHEYTVPVRIYHPAPTEARAVIVFYHGGGHMAGSVAVYDPICRRLAAATGQIVVSVDYRRSPENPYPAGLTDAYTAARGVWGALRKRQLPFRRELTLAGDSGGGAFAASVSRLAQFDPSLAITRQVLIYPSLDYTLRMPSVAENGEGYFLTESRVAWYFDHYFQHAENRLAPSPLYGEFTSRLPKTLVITAGFDPLRDEGVAYVEKLREIGVPAEHLPFNDLLHAFLNLEAMIAEECAATYAAIARFVNG
ncbi:alpha/beta hydrolase [Crenobacter sp. SG2303]|uniref:Alpha/beta hydrolase n=1 Tax=Crenobacter oryzisoli TaxID=3056844 RepID=A0ABT7XKZ7_9NEIS|nr:alpha/beta hydrolase [Crenobacter sp. SG2303]MDN0074452.1 alpha/beta hydrolase [Crenobacter sp. SG2303]